MDKKYFTIKEMQEHTGLSRTTLWKLSKREPFKHCFKKLGKTIRININEFDEIFDTYEAS